MRVERLLASPRRRRRIIRWVCVAAVAATAVTIGVVWPNTGREREHFTNQPVQRVAVDPASVPLARAQERAAENVLSKFVLTAVLRRHVAESWNLTAPSLKQGLTRKEWAGGNIPVPPFPAKYYVGGKLKLEYAHNNVARFETLLLGKRGSDYETQLYSMELRLYGPPHHRRWLVDYWMPMGGGVNTPVHHDSSAFATPVGDAPHLAFAWIFLPLGILSLVLLVPASVAVRSWTRNRRVARDYAARPLPRLRERL